MGEYVRPSELNELFAVLPQKDWKILAGGTDFYPAKVGQSLNDDILDITNIPVLTEITETEHYWYIGAAATWSDIAAAELPPLFDGLKSAAKEIGGRQIQNAGTLGGNICNASPAADGVPVLLSLDAAVVVSDGRNATEVPLQNFVTGNREIQLERGQIITEIVIPKVTTLHSSGNFLKLGSREYLVISLVMAAGVFGWNSAGIITHCRISVGACSKVAARLKRLEALIIGREITSDFSDVLSDELFSELTPIDDVRASGEYRKEAAKEIVSELLKCWSQ